MIYKFMEDIDILTYIWALKYRTTLQELHRRVRYQQRASGDVASPSWHE